MKKILTCVLLAVAVSGARPLLAQNYNVQLRSTMDFPGQTLANIWSYAQNGREYALVGASKGLVIVDVTDPEKPVQIVQIPGPDNLWKEIKTYQHFAYVTSEGGEGVQIVDLSNLPSANLNYHYYTGTGEIKDQLNTIHALHVDVTKGFLYTYGGNFNSVRVHDLNVDPYNPTYVGKFDQLGYIHDGYADNDTMYACHIGSGLLSIVDMRDKQNPVLLGSVTTPATYTHNSWLLDDHRHILTTDERTPAFLTAYDISDPSDIRELDRLSTNDGNGSIVHNTHVLNDWAITSWYTDGFNIVDAHRPDNLIQVGLYDTWPAGGPDFNGCWGVNPFLPSGNILATNIPTIGGTLGRLFVLTPQYVRACYLEGSVKDACTGQPITGAEVKINSTDPLAFTKSVNNGSFKTGQPTPGSFTVTVSKAGYLTKTVDVVLKTAEVTALNVALELPTSFSITRKMLNVATNAPIANASVHFKSNTQTYTAQTDATGQFNLNCVSEGQYRVGVWGYHVGDMTVSGSGAQSISLKPGYYDDFELDLGWEESATATSGDWVLGEPVGTNYNNNACNPDIDANSDANDQCYVTGNAGGEPGTDDVDNGSVTLISPPMQLSAYPDAVLSFWYWFFNSGGSGSPNDDFEVQVSNGMQTVSVFTQDTSRSEWRFSGNIALKGKIALTDNMQVRVIATDNAPGHLVEAGLDIFEVKQGVTGTFSPDPAARIALSPNPTASAFQLGYAWPAAGNLTLEVRNLLGQTVLQQALNGDTGTLRFGDSLTPGIYLVSLRSGGHQSAVLKAVKQ